MTITKRVSLFATALLVTVSALGQAAKTFDVATVKPSAPLDMAKLQAQMRAGQMPNFGAHLNGLRAEYNYMSMHDLLVYAYNVKPYQVVAPDWMNSAHFDIAARMPEGSTKDDAPEMLKALLIERFKLKAHLEDRDQPVMALVVGKDGPKLKDSPEQPPLDLSAPLKPGQMKMDLPDGPALVTGSPAAGQAVINMGTRGMFTEKVDPQAQALVVDGKGVAMTGFVDMVNQTMQIGGPGSRQVVDRTGLKGHYEVSLQIALADLMAAARRAGMDIPPGPNAGAGAASGEASDPGGASGSSITSSIEKLGLKLESSHATVQQLIVDQSEKMPTEN